MTRPDGQTVAARPESSAWVGASAGTGKTKVLTDRVLRLLVGGAAPERILCLTYTRAAAAEMANRIRDELGAWARSASDALRDKLAGLLETPPDDRALSRARDLFPLVLDTPGGMKIQTIHAFCEVVLGRFPLEARIPPWFAVMDERTKEETLRAARDRIVGAGGDARGSALATVAGRTTEDEFDRLMAQLAAGRARGAAAGGDAIFHRLGLEPGTKAEDLVAAACLESSFDRQGLLDAADALLGGSKTDRDRGQRIESWIADPARRSAGFAGYADVFLTQAGSVRARLATKAVAEAAPDMPGVLEAEAHRLAEFEGKRRACETAARSAALARVGEALLDAYETEKRARLRLDYDDLIGRTHRLLEDAGAAWIHYKLDHGIDHVLIDEAQDTSPEQWAIIRALTDDFFSDMGVGGPPGRASRTVFAVGDPKQSIFGFQGADPAWFARMEDHFRSRVEACGARWESVELDTSFRSTEPILAAVDAVLARIGDGSGLGAAAARHSAHRIGQAGEVVLWPAAREPDAPDVDPLDPPRPGDRRMSAFHRLAEAMAARIAGWIEDGAPLPSRGRRIRAGDVMVLVRRRTAFVDHLIRALKNAGVGVAGIDRLVLSDQLAVMDLLAVGEAALLPEDDLTMAAVLKGPLFGIDEETLFDLAHGRGKASLWRRLADLAARRPGLARHLEELKRIMAAAEIAPPFEFYMRILATMDGRTRILARLGPDAEDPIDEFLALALEYEREHPPSLQGFLAWFRAAATEVKRDLERAERDEVRVMTVHGAKGLEAPVVILADTMQVPARTEAILWPEDADGRRIPLWSPRRNDEDPQTADLRAEAARRRDEEYWRLLYVATTRAQDHLHVAGYETRRKPPETCWYNVVKQALEPRAEAFEMELGAPGIESWVGPALRLSSPQSRPPDRADPEGAAAPSGRPLPPWARLPAPIEPAPAPSLAPSRTEDDPDAPGPPTDGAAAGAQRGRLVHDLLRTLPGLPGSERAAAAAKYLARPAPGLSREAREELAAEALSVLDGERTAPFFGPGSRAEVPVAGRLGGRVWSGRIDRLKIGKTTVDVVEFKTTRTPPARAADTPDAWLRQIAAYRALVSKLYPDRDIRCFLVWTAGPRVDLLPNTVLNRHTP